MKVEIFSDIVCPWCYIGKRRFDMALERYADEYPDRTVEVAYRAYQLDPSAPVGVTQPVRDAYAAKFGGVEQADAIIDRVTREAATVGLTFRMDIAQRANTLAAHRLMVLGEHEGTQHELKDRLMAAYFCEGLDIGDTQTLVELAAQVGVDRSDAEGWLEGTSGNEEVLEAFNFALSAGISGVPTFVFDRARAFSGAQSPDVMFQGLEHNYLA